MNNSLVCIRNPVFTLRFLIPIDLILAHDMSVVLNFIVFRMDNQLCQQYLLNNGNVFLSYVTFSDIFRTITVLQLH